MHSAITVSGGVCTQILFLRNRIGVGANGLGDRVHDRGINPSLACLVRRCLDDKVLVRLQLEVSATVLRLASCEGRRYFLTSAKAVCSGANDSTNWQHLAATFSWFSV